MTDLHNAHVIITGGSRDIGLAAAVAVHRRGSRVSLIARSADTLQDAARRVGAGTATAAADVADPDAVVTAIDHLTEQHGPCDVMIANAGFSVPAPCWNLGPADYARQMSVNYLGAVHAALAVIPSMRARRRGHLCVVSSTAGLVAVYGFSTYSPTKFALRGLAESRRHELAPDGVRVSVFTITVDPLTAVLARVAGLLTPVTWRIMDQQIDRVRRRAAPAGTTVPQPDPGRLQDSTSGP